MFFSSLLAIASGVLCCTAQSFSTSPVWTHGWDNALGAQFIDFGYNYTKTLTTVDLAFLASHYQIISLEKCTGFLNGKDPLVPKISTETTVWAQAKKLKAINPKLKVLFYWHSEQGKNNCYAAHNEFMAHPEWWLKDDAGVVLNNEQGNYPRMDYSVPAARDWWVSVPLGGAGSPMSPWIDGVLADYTGSICPHTDCLGVHCVTNINPTRCQAIEDAKSLMVSTLQGLFNATNNGTVITNGCFF